MTPGEILSVIETHEKHRLMDNYNLSFMMINAKAKHPKSLYEMFPDTFKEEAKQAQLEKLSAFMRAQMTKNKTK